jgi:predicted dehydrogenase
MQTQDIVRIGFIGAGGIARLRHLPGLAAIAQVRVVAVCNRTRASAESVAHDFAIPEVVDDWHRLLERPDIDAVFIGTWPYMHKELSIAALESGKHVFCQARMARDLVEGKAMVQAAGRHPKLVNMICPPPHRMPFERYVRQALGPEMLGALVAVQVVSVSGANRDLRQVTWRERVELSGRQALALGVLAETLNAWVGPYRRLSAEMATPLAVKHDAAGRRVEVGIPQVLTVSGVLENGALASEQHLGLAADKSTVGDRITLWGLRGTLRHQFLSDQIEYAPVGGELRAVEVAPEWRRPWRVEADFVEAVAAARRGEKWAVSPDFAEALGYMRKVEAVHLAAATGRAVEPAKL